MGAISKPTTRPLTFTVGVGRCRAAIVTQAPRDDVFVLRARFRDCGERRRFRVRHVDVESAAYQMLAAYMIRLTRADLEDPGQVKALAQAGALDEATLVQRFADVAAPGRHAAP